eukprot:gene19950-23722_t
MPEMGKYSQGTESYQQFAIRIADMLLEISAMIKLNNLSTDLKHVTVEYLDIVNYEIARENICGYIFLLSRLSKDAEPTEKMQLPFLLKKLLKTIP